MLLKLTMSLEPALQDRVAAVYSFNASLQMSRSGGNVEFIILNFANDNPVGTIGEETNTDLIN